MAISFVPRPGTVLLCDYTTGFVPPEMTKRRPVVVLSPRQSTVLIVPISTSRPVPPELYHVLIPAGKYRFLHQHVDSWVKGDMIPPYRSRAYLRYHRHIYRRIIFARYNVQFYTR